MAIALAYPPVAVGQTGSTPPVSLRQLRFSPDGRYVLAQDDAEVTVLTVQPLTIAFRIPARNATDAQFTPDSREVVFATSVAHVERWGIVDRRRVALDEVPLQACATERLSPDGRTLACVDPGGTLWLVDVGSRKTVLKREKYVTEAREYAGGRSARIQLVILDPSLARLGFSPDGRFFLAAPAMPYQTPKEVSGAVTVLAWDTHEKKEVPLGGETRDLRHGSSVDYAGASLALQYFVFTAPDRLMISSMWSFRRGSVTARLVAFPSGVVLSKPKLRPGPLVRATDPGFVIVRPFPQFPLPLPPFEFSLSVGGQVFRPPAPQADPANQTRRSEAVEIATGQLIVSETPALDVLGSYYVAEPRPGEVGLYERGKGLQATVALHRN
jgi:hypothetical protein